MNTNKATVRGKITDTLLNQKDWNKGIKFLALKTQGKTSQIKPNQSKSKGVINKFLKIIK